MRGFRSIGLRVAAIAGMLALVAAENRSSVGAQEAMNGARPHARDGRIHFVQWCGRCEQWSCSDCGQNCGCPAVVTPHCAPTIAPPCLVPGVPDLSPGATQMPTFPPSSEPSTPSPSDQTPGGMARDLPTPMPLPGATPSSPATSANDNRPSASDLAGLAGSLGAGMGSVGVPNMIGDSFGGAPGSSTFRQTVSHSLQATGQTANSFPGDPNGFIAYEVTSGATSFTHDDFFSDGLGRDEIGGSGADTFDITEPVPPSGAPTSPGPDYVFDGGTARNPTGTYQDDDVWDVNYSFSRQITLVIPDPSSGGLVVGRLKIAENTSPLPRSRVFFNYSLFDNVPLIAGGTPVHRFSPGFERANQDGTASVEMRFPFAATIDSTLFADTGETMRDVEWGNLFIAFKRLLARGPQGAISMGLVVTVPTAEDLSVSLRDGTPLARIENESVHVMPFLGWLHAPNDRYFAQGFFQLDFDVNGNTASVNQFGTGLVPLGRAQASSFLYVDVGMGYWLYRDPNARGRVTGIAPMAELHYNRSLQSSDVLVSNGFQIGGGQQDIQQLNSLLGCTFQLGDRANATVGYATPIGNGADQMFDGELRVLFNRFY